MASNGLPLGREVATKSSESQIESGKSGMVEIFQAILLQAYETGNSSEVLHAISAEHGRLSLYARGLRNPKSRFRGILQPLSLVELKADRREDAEMATLHEASAVENPGAISADFERLAIGLLLAEAAFNGCEPMQPAPEIYGALQGSLRELHPESGLSAPFAGARGLLAILEAAGYMPFIEPAALQPWPAAKPKPVAFWLEKENGAIHLECAQPPRAPEWPFDPPANARRLPIPPEGVRFLYEWQGGAASTLPLDSSRAAHMILALSAFAEHHFERPMKSRRFFKEVFC